MERWLSSQTQCDYGGRIYLFRKNMVRLGWGSYAFKQARMGMSTPETDLRRRFSEQLNAHSELLNATMRHLGTELVAFTLGRHLRLFDNVHLENKVLD